jgi:hypothetical protein
VSGVFPRAGSFSTGGGPRKLWFTVDGVVPLRPGSVLRVPRTGEGVIVEARVGRDVRLVRGRGMLKAREILGGDEYMLIGSAL